MRIHLRAIVEKPDPQQFRRVAGVFVFAGKEVGKSESPNILNL